MSGAHNELIAEDGSSFIGAVEGGGAILALDGAGAGTISDLGAIATLTGAVAATISGFGSYVIGAGGAWTLAGANGLNADAGLTDLGTLINRGVLTLSGPLSIQSSGVLRLSSGNIVAGDGAARIFDDGLLIKSPGIGEITIGVRTYDDAIVEASTGTLDFTAALLGKGVLKIDSGGTLRADATVASSLTATFSGTAATLALSKARLFHGAIGGFAKGDAIDLLKTAATGASVNAGDQLVILDGARTVATLQLAGDYIGATFDTKSDGAGGTNVELVSASKADVPNVQIMVSAMAALAAPAGAAHPWRDLYTDRAQSLANPYLQRQ